MLRKKEIYVLAEFSGFNNNEFDKDSSSITPQTTSQDPLPKQKKKATT